MKTNTIYIIAILIALATAPKGIAQTVVVEENFDGNELGWTENTKPDLGECIIMEGELKFEPKITSRFFTYYGNREDTNHPSLLTSEAVMPINPSQGFELSTDMTFDRLNASFGGSSINNTSGFLLEYDDDYNFIAVAANAFNCFIVFYVDGELKRYKVAAVKMKAINKNKIMANLKIVYRDYKLRVLVDDIEMVELRKVNIESPTFALFATGTRKVNFDNVIISQ